ncbi:MAG: PilN domain-containing protein, partial [Thermoleophilia bacterium]
MPRVNLVPKEETAREFRRQFLIVPVASVAVIFIGMVGSYVYYGQKLQSANDELDQYRQNNASQKKDIAELDAYEAVGKQKQEKQVQVGNLELQRHKWSRTLDDIAFVVPDDIWFKDIQGQVPWLQVNPAESGLAGERGDHHFIIEGRTNAESMPSVAIFMVRLGLIPSLEKVELIFAEKILEDGREVIQFEIGASLKQEMVITQPAIAPSTGEEAPSNGSQTGTGTSTTSTNGGSTSTGTTGT